jgi:hypothetical protein
MPWWAWLLLGLACGVLFVFAGWVFLLRMLDKPWGEK